MFFKKKNLFFIGLIIFIVLVFGFYNNVFASSGTFEVNSGYGIGSNSTIISADGWNLLSFDTSPNYIYTVGISRTYSRILWLLIGDSVSVGSQVQQVSSFSDTVPYSFVGSGHSYVIEVPDRFVEFITLDITPVNGFDSTTSSLIDSVSLDNLWSVVPPTLIALCVLFAIGYIVVKKVLKRDSNAY